MKKDTKAKRKILPEISKADLHIHALNDGKATPEEIVDWVHEKTDLSVIAVTDHDDVTSAYEAQDIAKKKGYKFEVIIGEEVTAKEGHISALFIKERIKPGMSAKQTIAEIHRQGGVAVAAHPLFQTRLRNPKHGPMDGVGLVTLVKENFDAVEIVNATPTFTDENLKAKYINRALLFHAETGSSDAHIKEAIGMGYTLFDGKTAEDLKKALIKGQTQAYLKKWHTMGVLRYLYFYIPTAFRNAFWGLRHGFSAKEPNIIKVPKDFK